MKIKETIHRLKTWIFQSKIRCIGVCVAIIVFIYLPLFTANINHHIKPKKLSSGSKQYFLLAYHMLHHRVYSMSYSDSPDVPLSSYRPPGYSTFLALCMTVIPDFRNISLKNIVKRDENGKKIINSKDNRGFLKIKYCEALLHFFVSLMAMWLTWKITNKYYSAILVLLLVGFHPKLSSSVNTLHSEILQSFLATSFSILMLYIVEKKKIIWFALSGLLLGCLTLTRGSWYYFCIPALIYFFYMAWHFPNERRRIFFGTTLFMIFFLLFAGGWMARNYYHFKRAFIAQRGGHVLDTRMNINMMNWKEYKASFLLWSNNKYLKETLLNKLFKPEEWAQLDRNNTDGFYRTARKRGRELRKQYGAQIGDKMQLKEAVKKFFRNPVRHIYITIPITYRGIQKISRQEAISILIIILSAIAIASSVLTKNIRAIAILFPVGIMFMFNCFCTHNLPRYNVPYIPLFIVAAFAGFDFILKWIKQRTEHTAIPDK